MAIATATIDLFKRLAIPHLVEVSDTVDQTQSPGIVILIATLQLCSQYQIEVQFENRMKDQDGLERTLASCTVVHLEVQLHHTCGMKRLCP